MRTSKLSICYSAFACVAAVTLFAPIAFGATTEVSGDDHTQAAPAGVIENLVAAMGSDKPKERESAQSKLIALGESALPALQAAVSNNDDPEVRSRAAAVVAEIKDQRANGPTLITLHVKDASVQAALDALGSQSQAALTGADSIGTTGDGGEQSITIDADQKPFWEVMESLCSQAGAGPALDSPRSSSNRSLRLVKNPRDWLATSPHQVVGPFWVGVAGINRDQSLDLAGPARYWDQFYIRVNVVPEPKLLTQLVSFVVTEAVDDAGHSLMPASHALRMPIDPMKDGFQLEAPLTFPEHAGTKIAHISGEVTVLVGQQYQPFVVDDPVASPKPHSPLSGDAKAVVVALPHGLYSVTLKGTRGVSEQQWSMSDLRLEDADGRALIPYINPRTNSQSRAFYRPGNYSLSSMFMRSENWAAANPPIGEAKRLLWNIPTAFETVKIPVTFTDLPLPGR